MRILVVEDSQTTCNFTALILHRDGHQVHTAYSGADALEHCRTSVFDFVLLDMKLPDMQGLDVARLIRLQSPATGRLIAITGHDPLETKRSDVQGLLDAIITKPVNFKALRHHLLANTSPRACNL